MEWVAAGVAWVVTVGLITWALHRAHAPKPCQEMHLQGRPLEREATGAAAPQPESPPKLLFKIGPDAKLTQLTLAELCSYLVIQVWELENAAQHANLWSQGQRCATVRPEWLTQLAGGLRSMRAIFLAHIDNGASVIAEEPAAPAEQVRVAPASEGAQCILEERLRQITAEGWTPEHDDEHEDEQLADAAACYAAVLPLSYNLDVERGKEGDIWPWAREWDKRRPVTTTDERIRELEKAGALCAAEIDRLLRKQRRGA